MLERDDFAKRFEARQPISVHELLYPLMQGYDSVAIRADIELGAHRAEVQSAGRPRAAGRARVEPRRSILTLPVLPGLDGVQRMSKSLGNYIGVDRAAHGDVRQGDEPPRRASSSATSGGWSTDADADGDR